MYLLSDEEIGGHDGMKKFVHTPDFKALNVGFALDEGMANPNEEFIIFNGERSIWRKYSISIKITLYLLNISLVFLLLLFSARVTQKLHL